MKDFMFIREKEYLLSIYILDEYENIVKLETHINYYRSDVLKHIPSFVNNINLYELNEKMLKL